MKAAHSMIMAAALLAGASGCAVQTADEGTEQVSEQNSRIFTDNGLSLNGLIANALSFNALAQNALAQNGYFADGVVFEVLSRDDDSGAWARHFYHYAATCALAPGQSTTYWGGYNTGWVTVYGQLGYAPEWAWGPLIQKKLVNACLAARVNRYGNPVSISLSLWGEGSVDAAYGYSLQEGCFWGGILGYSYVDVWACQGEYAQYVAARWGRDCTLYDCGPIRSHGVTCQQIIDGGWPPNGALCVSLPW